MTLIKGINYILRYNVQSSMKYYFVPFRNRKCVHFWSRGFITSCQVRSPDKKDLVKTDQSNSNSQVSVDYKKLVKENTKSAWYLGVIIVGVGMTCLMFYATFKELFSSTSSNGVYSKALKRIEKEYDVVEALGEPIKAYGEESLRRRRGHVAHQLFLDEKGKKHMRMQFYLKGSRLSGTAYLEVKENESKSYEYRYLYVQLNDYKRTVIMIEDNRLKDYKNESEMNLM